MTPDEWTAVKELVEQYAAGIVVNPWDLEYVCIILGIESLPD